LRFADRPLRLWQDDAAPSYRRPGAGHDRDPAGEWRHARASAQAAGLRLRLSGTGAVSLTQRRTQRDAAIGSHGPTPRRASGPSGPRAGPGRTRGVPATVSVATIRWHAAARLDRARIELRAKSIADG